MEKIELPEWAEKAKNMLSGYTLPHGAKRLVGYIDRHPDDEHQSPCAILDFGHGRYYAWCGRSPKPIYNDWEHHVRFWPIDSPDGLARNKAMDLMLSRGYSLELASTFANYCRNSYPGCLFIGWSTTSKGKLSLAVISNGKPYLCFMNETKNGQLYGWHEPYKHDRPVYGFDGSLLYEGGAK